jgi:hypothetical protein
LPDKLKYAYIDEKKIYPVIISSKLLGKEEERLLEILRKHRGAMGHHNFHKIYFHIACI